MGEANDAVKTIAALAQKAPALVPVTSEPVHFIAVPNDCKLESLERFQFAAVPQRKRANVQLFDVASFVQYFNSFNDPNSQIFACPDQLTFTAILDYHEMGDGRPRFGDHRATLTCKTSREWNVWHGSNNKAMEQTEFALFLEDHAPNVVNGAALVDVARCLKAKKDVEFSSDVNLSNGQIQFHYHETIQGRIGGGEIEAPETFTLRIPVYWNGPVRDISVRLRWRVTNDKKLTFWYTMIQAKKILEDGFAETVSAITAQTKTAVMLGQVG